MAKAAAVTAKKAPTKLISTNNSEATLAVKLHKEINELKTQVKLKEGEFAEVSTQIKELSTDIFNRDIGEIGGDFAPEVYGNHEYNNGEVVVNFKTNAGGMTFRQVGKLPACEVLPKIMGEDNYKKLFTETIVVEDDMDNIRKVGMYRPEVVGFRLDASKLPEEAYKELLGSYPDAFTPYIKDTAAYAKDIPTAVVATDVTTVTGFIEKVSSLPDSVRYSIKDLIRKVMSTVVTTAIKCGNKAD
jgi:hypothetical protein